MQCSCVLQTENVVAGVTILIFLFGWLPLCQRRWSWAVCAAASATAIWCCENRNCCKPEARKERGCHVKCRQMWQGASQEWGQQAGEGEVKRWQWGQPHTETVQRNLGGLSTWLGKLHNCCVLSLAGPRCSNAATPVLIVLYNDNS